MRSTAQLMDLSGRVALITGGAGHVGSAIAEALAECGAEIVLLDRYCWKIDLETLPFKALVCPLDLANSDEIEGLGGWVVRKKARLDILVNCAAYLDGPGLDVPIMEQSQEDWDRSYAVNLRAPFMLIQACLPALRASGHGSIINVSSIYGAVGPDLSIYGDTGMGCGSAYAATKGGLIALTRHLATRSDVVPVRVNSIVLGGIARGQDAGFVERYCRHVPLARMGTEEDVKGVAAFLASDASAYVTGAAIPVDGGWTAW